jgi:stringent starvation protein B
MTSTRPYLLRAMHEWMLDNGLTPQLVVDADSDEVQVPRQYVEDGRIVLNVAASAVRDLSIGNERVEFMARFSGTPSRVSVPVRQVLAIVARENGAGMSFPEDVPPSVDPPPEHDPTPSPPSGRSHLKVVK